MNSYLTEDFLECFRRLPQEIKEKARRNYHFWKQNPNHPSFQFKRVHKGIERGIEQERCESAIRHILVVLKTKFSADIVNVLTPAIQNISNVERLEALLPAAVEAQSLEAFARILHE